MSVTIEEVHAFIKQAEKARENWLKCADQSWGELKKRRATHRLWSFQPNSLKRRARYPAWYSINQIRKPLLLSRAGIPIGKDTTQDGSDNVGATAALVLERLATNLARSFDFLDVMCACRDDFLATNFATCRAYYEREEIKQRVQEFVQFVQDGNDPNGGYFVGSSGERIVTDDISQDDQGNFFVYTNQVIDVDNERVCLEYVLYRDFYVDAGIRRWNRCKRAAYRHVYSEREFKDIFGFEAMATLPRQNESEQNADQPKRQEINVFEYWDEYDNEVKWLAQDGTDFIKPKSYTEPESQDDEVDREISRGLYNLEKFFPSPDPLLINQATDEFWPIPEFYQIWDLIEDIHTIFSRLIALTKAIRARILFDANVEGLQVALNEATEGDAIGVTNLAQSLSQNGGTLRGVVQYIPVEEMITGINELYKALDQRLQSLFQLTGTSDLLQGLSADASGKTLGERQMEEKYAINQIAEAQRKMQEFMCNAYRLLTEVALKNFKDESLDRYVMPQTMPPEHQPRYKAALTLLKDDFKRFRIELETDSTIAINEQYDKQVRLELVNTLTGALEKTANTAKASPALVAVELHCLKYLIQGFRQGKMFQDEMVKAIDNVIEMSQKEPAPFNKDMADYELQKQKFALEVQKATNEAKNAIAQLQIEGFKANQDAAATNQGLSLQAQKQMLEAQLGVLNYELQRQKVEGDSAVSAIEANNKMADNMRLEKELELEVERTALEADGRIGEGAKARAAQPQVTVIPIPMPQPAAGPTIINAPQPSEPPRIVQPVQQVPVPVPVPTITRGII